MKRVLTVFLSLITMFCALGLAGCECSHKNITEQTLVEPTCSGQGVIVATCADCGKCA